MDFQSFINKFNLNELIVYQGTFWTWSLRTPHPTLGSSILFLNKPKNSLSEISDEENVEFLKIIKIIEFTLKLEFNYSKINYFCLMMFDPFVHFHIVPRYHTQYSYNNSFYIDDNYPKLPDLNNNILKNETLFLIKEILKVKIVI
jgi:diadenosine tetraphosphate (Ap4A) HIT family hydrolase